MAVEVYMKVDGLPGLWRFLDLIDGRYVIVSPDDELLTVKPWLCRIVGHRMLKA